MLKPTREANRQPGYTYFVTTQTLMRRPLFRTERWCELMMDVLEHYRGKAYLLQEFVIMPDHLHLLLTPTETLERAVQFIKGGFSYRVKKELGSNTEIWQRGFSDHRIRDEQDYRIHVAYTLQNPVKRGLCFEATEFRWSSANPLVSCDEVPQRLKPQVEVSL